MDRRVMTWSRCVAALLVGLGTASRLSAEDPKPDAAAGIEAKAAFEALARLVGEWTGTAMGEPTTVRYRLVGAGSALVEEQFPGTEFEMLTVYFLDGPELRLTHYCAAGNQPRMRLDRRASTAAALQFRFDGGTNLDPGRDHHMHEARIELKDANHLESRWTGYHEGKPAHTAVFVLTRRAN